MKLQRYPLKISKTFTYVRLESDFYDFRDI